MLPSKVFILAIKSARVCNFKQAIKVFPNRFSYYSLNHIKKMSTNIAASSQEKNNNQVIVKVYDSILKPKPDSREYRGLELQNGMKCLLISDSKTDKSAAAVDVNIGYLVDPIPGLAHFCEHMLFLGSTKFPQENTYSKFIEENGGSSNAFTSFENTNYYFEIANQSYKEAIDIFSQFFISPLFDPSSVDREINAVNSENNKNLQVDAWRINQLEKSFSRSEHPYSKFGTGNSETLKTIPTSEGISTRDELIKFHGKYYSSNLMSLCLLGAEPLDTLQEYAVTMFSGVKNKSLSKLTFEKNPFSDDSLRDINYVIPIQDTHYLNVLFQLPDYSQFYESDPCHYVSHLIGHEGQGSLLSELKSKGWCNALYSGPKHGARGFQFFTISLDLSEEGIKHIDEILKFCFQYLNMLRKEGPQQWISEELSDLGQMKFTYKDKEEPMRYVSSLTGDMHIVKLEDSLSGNYLIKKFEPKLITEIYDHLKPELMKVFAVSKNFEGKTDKTEKWYGTQYKTEKLSAELLDELKSCGLNEAFKQPLKNDFIPQDFSLIKHENGVDEFPVVIHKTPVKRLWYKGDDKFLLPKASIKFEFRNPITNLDPINYNMTSLFIELLCDSLTEYTYAADLAGLRYSLNQTNYGIQLSVNGFNNKMDVLVDKIVKRMSNFKIDEKRFNVLKENYQRNLQNFQVQQPYNHAIYFMQQLLIEKGWTKEELLNAINDFSYEDIQAFIPKLLTQGIFIEALVFGNLTKEKAIEIVNNVEERLKQTTLVKVNQLKPLLPAQLNNYRHVKLPKESEFIYINNNKIHKTIGIESYFQCNEQCTRNNTLIELFCQIINESTYNVLRTQEQLGYIVASGIRRFNGMQGVRFILQSDKSPDYLDSRIENFISTLGEMFEKMSEEQFNNHKNGLSVIKLEEAKKVSKQADIYWGEILSHQYNFNREKIEVEELKKLTKENIIEFFNNYIKVGGAGRKKVSVYINPAELTDEYKSKINKTIISDINDFKANLSLCPLPKPCCITEKIY